MIIDENALNIYTDGSSFSSPRTGGIGVRFVFPYFLKKDKNIKDLSLSGYKGANNNQMELKACIVALREVLKFDEIEQVQRIIIHTDSMYIVNNYKKAIYQWPPKWEKSTGAPVINTDLWKELIKNVKKTNLIVDIAYIKRNSNEHNRAVDKLAKKSAKIPIKKLPNPVNVRRKLSDKSVDIGIVKMLGQKVLIRIIIVEYLKTHKVYKYKYEIISKRSTFYECVDIIFYDKPLRAGHVYLVSFNKNNEYPQISNMFREIKK